MNGEPVILYVEDDSQSREIMQLLVEDVMGLSHLTIFEDSNDFLFRVEALNPQPELILLDIHVPPHDGFEMLAMLRDNGFHDTPVVAVTASVMNEEIEQLKKVGFDGVLAKPLDMDSLPVTLERIVAGETIWHVLS